MPWGVVAAAVIGYAGASKQAGAAKKGAQAQSDAAQASIDEQRRQYDQTRTDQLPWLHAGTGALGQLGQLNSGDFSSFQQSPDYQFAYDQGLKTLDRSAAAHGRINSGGYEQDLVKYGQGMATQNYNNYYNRIAGIAGVGQNAAQSLGGFGQNMANQIGQQYNNIGNAQQSSYAGQANAWSNYANSLSGMAGQYAGQRGGSGSGYGWGGV